MLIKVYNGKKPKDSQNVFDNPSSSLSKMTKDRAMVRMILDGKGSDKGLRREAEAIERENSNKAKERFYSDRYRKLDEAKREYQRSLR